ncbi:hypothetical protein DWW17_07195 [Bacteroides sp. AF14-46]|nr:hypothetical protein DWW17_07195 [Bacteroides sp. AF14-46]HBB49912.1 hypothetical protein [Barnesiella sp.]
MLYQLSYCGNCGAKVIYLKKHRNSFSLFFSYQTKKKKFILLFSLKISNEISMYENTKHNNTQEGEINFISPSCIQI